MEKIRKGKLKMRFMLDNQESRIKNRECVRGAVAAELAVLVVFVYVPLTIGAIYIGWLALAALGLATAVRRRRAGVVACAK